MVKFRVAFVGHSQLPLQWPNSGTGDEEIEARVFRSPGAKARYFHRDPLLREVLEWEHDLTILWLGSNDIRHETSTAQLAQNIREIVAEIERRCLSKVIVTLIEPRLRHRRANRLEGNDYDLVAKSVNRRLKRSLSDHRFLNFTAPPYKQALSPDGVHFTAAGREMLRARFVTVIAQEHEDFLIKKGVPGPFRP